MTGCPCDAARQRRIERDVELRCRKIQVPCGIRIRPELAVGGGGDGIVGPRIPDRAGRANELSGPFVPELVIEKTAASEVLPGPRVVGGDGIPPRPAPRQNVQTCQTPGQVRRLVVRGVLRGDQTDAVGDACQRGKLCDGVGATGDVEIEDLAVLLPQSQTLAEEERVEQSALGRRDHATEGLEVDLRTARRIRPDRRVVDALEEDTEVHLGVGAVDFCRRAHV